MSLLFHILKLVKLLPIHTPETSKRMPFGRSPPPPPGTVQVFIGNYFPEV